MFSLVIPPSIRPLFIQTFSNGPASVESSHADEQPERAEDDQERGRGPGQWGRDREAPTPIEMELPLPVRGIKIEIKLGTLDHVFSHFCLEDFVQRKERLGGPISIRGGPSLVSIPSVPTLNCFRIRPLASPSQQVLSNRRSLSAFIIATF